MSPPFTVDTDVYMYLYSKNPEMVTTFEYRTCHKSIYEGSMYIKNQLYNGTYIQEHAQYTNSFK
jgi:hypothetical protein